jgi:hypothetical protein
LVDFVCEFSVEVRHLFMVKEGRDEHESFPHIHVLFPHICIIVPHSNNANKKTQKKSGFIFSRLEWGLRPKWATLSSDRLTLLAAYLAQSASHQSFREIRRQKSSCCVFCATT